MRSVWAERARRHGDDRCVRPANALARIYLSRGEDDRAEAVLVRAYTRKAGPGGAPPAETPRGPGGGGDGVFSKLTSTFSDFTSLLGRSE